MIAPSAIKGLSLIYRCLRWLTLLALFCVLSLPLRSQQVARVPGEVTAAPAFLPLVNDDAAAQQHVDPRTVGLIKGKVVDQSGVPISGAVVKLTRDDKTLSPDVSTDEEGVYLFINVPPGPFQINISSEGLVSQTFTGTLHAAESYVVPQATLTIATQVTEVTVGLNPIELAQEQVIEQEHQRVFGIIPNFYVSYSADAAPLNTKQKFHLAWKSASDPVTLAGVGLLAGIYQATDRWGAYGQGVQGYAKRYGATYADIFDATFLAGAVLPAVFKQDPRYFYKGTGSKKSRILYALRSTIICKGDNGNWQPNYSAVVGDLAGAGLSNLYYPPNDRNGIGGILGNTAIRFGEIGVSYILQEFIIPKFTPNLSNRAVHQ
jgi:Carboxypeptidase regulatory-like domain